MALQAEPIPANRLYEYEVQWACAGASGTVHVLALTATDAVRAVKEHGIAHGLPHDHPLVGRAEPLDSAEDTHGTT